MKKNMGTLDKVIRIIIAVILGILYFTGTITGTWGIIILTLLLLTLAKRQFTRCA